MGRLVLDCVADVRGHCYHPWWDRSPDSCRFCVFVVDLHIIRKRSDLAKAPKIGGLTRGLLRAIALAAVSVAVSACAFMPSSGPSSDQIERLAEGGEGARRQVRDYVVVDLTTNVVRTLAAQNPLGLSPFRKTKASLPRARIGIGDVLAITIWEAGEGGLFSSAAGKSVNMPSVVVDRDGNISLPYAGVIKVVGNAPLQVEKKIIEGLSKRAIHPQAVVNIVKNESNTVVVSGEVAKPGKYVLSLKGDRLLDVLAEGGGAKFPAQETYVTFVRGKERGTQLLKAIIENNEENVFIRAGDQIYLTHEPKKYTVLGAVAKPGVYPFGSPEVNLLEAVAGAGGLVDERADGTGLFVFRHEYRHVVELVSPGRSLPAGSVIPVVYRVNMRDPSAYFFAKAFNLRDKDALYVSNARGVEVAKVLSLISLGTKAVGNITAASRIFGD